jgi:hypothetical protein
MINAAVRPKTIIPLSRAFAALARAARISDRAVSARDFSDWIKDCAPSQSVTAPAAMAV